MKIALIGAGPAGLAAARALSQLGLPFVGIERHGDVGGLWDIDSPWSAVYASAHLISSARRTEFAEFPMPAGTPDYPGHALLLAYLRAYAAAFDLKRHYRFGVELRSATRAAEGGWQLQFADGSSEHFSHLITATGTFSKPLWPTLPGQFSGTLTHSAHYKQPGIFAGKRVLVVGAGNSACDIAVDAVHHAASVDWSLRRGVHFVPKFIAGKPADMLGGAIRLPASLKQKVDGLLLKLLIGDPTRLGLPKPDHRLYESHPVVNSLVLHHVGHGDIRVRRSPAHFDGSRVHFSDGEQAEYDVVLMATGFTLDFGFLPRECFDWNGDCPQLYLNSFHPSANDLFVLGMVEATGIGWEGRARQAMLVATAIQSRALGRSGVADFDAARAAGADLSGGFKYLPLQRMAFYVHRDTFLKRVEQHIQQLGT